MSEVKKRKTHRTQLGGDYFRFTIEYVLEEGEVSNADKFIELLKRALPHEKENIMTIAQQLRQEGLQQEKHNIAENLLKANQPIDFVEKMTGLSESEVKKLKATIH